MITIKITYGPTFKVAWKSNMNVQQAIETAYNNAATGTFTYSLQYYGSSLGYLVTMINETYESFNSKEAPFFFWEFLLNGKVSSTGIDNTFLKDGDEVIFEFSPYLSTIPSESTIHKKFQSKINS